MGKHNPNGRFDEAEKNYILMSGAGRFDESFSAFLARELTYIRTRVLEVRRAPLRSY